jgi:hypothetical protein
MKVKIFRPTKSAMQSGKKNTKKWLVQPIEETNIRFAENIMGWISANDTTSQLRFEFLNKEDAIKFAIKQGFEYEVEEPETSKIRPKSYSANFTN